MNKMDKIIRICQALNEICEQTPVVHLEAKVFNEVRNDVVDSGNITNGVDYFIYCGVMFKTDYVNVLK